jgi:hypothetical protein
MPNFSITFYVPQDHADNVLEAIFEAGAGHIGNYDQCCFRSVGTGQFRPLEGSDPFLGDKLKLEYVPETKVELICSEAKLNDAIKALKMTHPYEEPAYHVVPVVDI